MSARTLAMAMLLASSAASACDAATTAMPDAYAPDTDEPREVPRSAAFLITHVEIQRVTNVEEPVIGIDLDDRVTTGDDMAADCRERHADRVSPSGVVGVDNQLAVSVMPLIGDFFGDFDPEQDFDEPIESGEQLYAIRVSELDDLVNDPDVVVAVQHVVTPGCDEPPCPPGEVAPRAVFHASREVPIASDLRGAIVEGHLRFELPMLPLGGRVPLLLEDLVVDVSVGEDALAGTMAGEYPFWALMQLTDSILPPPITPMDPTPFQRRVADLHPSERDASLCDGVSSALTIEATRILLPVRR
jgi:hypothetical protein